MRLKTNGTMSLPKLPYKPQFRYHTDEIEEEEINFNI